VNSKEIIDAFTYVANEKSIDKMNLTAIVEDIFATLIAKKYGEDNADKFSVIVNMDRGEIEIFQEKMVVENITDPLNEILLEDALKIDDTMSSGEICIDIIDPANFGRRLINTAKHHLLNKIKDVEKKSVYDEFYNKVDQIYTGYVHQIQRNRIFINDENKNELILPKGGQIPNDRYKRGQQVRGLITKVEYSIKGLEIILSRTDDNFLKRLFELEVPEIDDGIIEIKAISRVPGERSKVVTYSSDRRIDAVGACVGMKGNRIQSVVRELNGEKIDIINWSEKPEILISRALAPANPVNLFIDEEKPYAVAVFEDDDIAIAIGSNGQNVKLASCSLFFITSIVYSVTSEANLTF
jgi:N utilization substance protein A